MTDLNKEKVNKSIKRSDERSFWKLKANAPVFISSFLIVAAVICVTIIVGDPMSGYFSTTQEVMADKTGWFFILVMNLFVGFALYLGLSKFGNIRIGGADAKPEFKTKSWLAMLFSAGMGIGLLFYGVAEPIFHFNNSPMADASDPILSSQSAMGFTFLHYGVHVWSLYAIVGLALAYFTFNKKLPLTIRSIFYPLIGDKIYGWRGNLIDIVSVIATLFGLATSLGLGVQQVNAGLHYLFGVDYNMPWQIGIITLITFFATLSLLLGLDKGIRRLSEWNMRLALVLLIFVLLLGPTIFLLKSFVQNTGYYMQNYFNLSFWTETYMGAKEGSKWQNAWTIFYWAWWIAWSPFVGLFIARISKGRTIRQFVLCVLFFPTLLTFLWISVFGGSALYLEMIGNHSISEAVNANFATAIYQLLENYPMATLSSVLAVILVASFFITSSDSGSMVVDSLTSGGKLNAPAGQKIFWASIEGLIAIILLIGGGLTALQTATIITGLPFAILILIMCYSLYRTLDKDYKKETTKK